MSAMRTATFIVILGSSVSAGGLAQFDNSGNGPRRELIVRVVSPHPAPLPREREQRAARRGKPRDLDCSPRREWFTLSPRERAGVRGNGPPHGAARISSTG